MADDGGSDRTPDGNAPSRRRTPRTRTLKAGRLIVDRSGAGFDVIVRDLSDSGARLRLAAPTMLEPEPTGLYMVKEDILIPIRVVWQRGADVGVEFKRG